MLFELVSRSGLISDDGEHFKGQLNANPYCKCLGATPDGNDDTCGKLKVDGVSMCWSVSFVIALS